MYVAVVGHKIIPIANRLNKIQKSSSAQLFVFNFSYKLPIGMPFFPQQYLARKSIISLSSPPSTIGVPPSPTPITLVKVSEVNLYSIPWTVIDRLSTLHYLTNNLHKSCLSRPHFKPNKLPKPISLTTSCCSIDNEETMLENRKTLHRDR